MLKLSRPIESRIHLNNAAASLADESVFAAMSAYLELESRIGTQEAMLSSADDLNAVYSGLSALISVDESQISVAGSNTFAWQTAFHAVPLNAGDRILVGESEWGGNLSAIWQRCRATGAAMEFIPSDSCGAISPDALCELLDDRVKIVCVTMVPAVNGLINPVEVIAEALENHPAWLFVDAAQAFGQVIVDLSHPRFDLVTTTARKFLRGPRGIGFAIYSQRFLDRIEPVGLDQFSGPWGVLEPKSRMDARKFEFGESQYVVRIGLKVAIEVALARDLVADMNMINTLARHARCALAEIPDITLEDTSHLLAGIVTFSHNRFSPLEIADALKNQNIYRV